MGERWTLEGFEQPSFPAERRASHTDGCRVRLPTGRSYVTSPFRSRSLTRPQPMSDQQQGAATSPQLQPHEEK